MRLLARVLGWILIALGGLLTLVGLMTLPPGGLMFALPFVFLMPGALFLVIGALLVRLGREPVRPRDDDTAPVR